MLNDTSDSKLEFQIGAKTVGKNVTHFLRCHGILLFIDRKTLKDYYVLGQNVSLDWLKYVTISFFLVRLFTYKNRIVILCSVALPGDFDIDLILII